MTTKHAINTTGDLMKLFGYLKVQQLPITVAVKDGVDRSLSQSNLSFKWYKEVADWLGDRDADSVRSYCKLHHGVKMLLVEDEEFHSKWYTMIKDRFTYEEKLALMSMPWDFPVTRLMKSNQMHRYLNAIHDEFTAQGVPLSLPDDLKYKAEMGERV